MITISPIVPTYNNYIYLNKKNKTNSNNLSFTAKTIAVTGNIAAGKSTVRKIFERHNIKCIDVDDIVHNLYLEDKSLINSVKEMFESHGIFSLREDNFIDRSKIRTLVFQNKNIKKDLENIIHPAVNKKVHDFIQDNKSNDFVAIFNPLLFETNNQKNYDYVTLIKVNPQEQLRRLLFRNSFLTEKTAMERINPQISQNIKENRADFVIDNSAGFEHTATQVVNIINRLRMQPEVTNPNQILSTKLYLKYMLSKTLTNLGISNEKADKIFEDFMTAYDKTARGYHGIKHIEMMLKCFDDFILKSKSSVKIKNPNEFRLAIFMHDYVNGVPDEVKLSCETTEKIMQSASENYNTSNIKKLIIATDYSVANNNLSFAEKLMQDIDLAILGQNKSKYDNYSRLIRLQYSDFPDEVFNPERIKILQSFLDKPHIYNTEYFKSVYEQQARENLSAEIKSLAGN